MPHPENIAPAADGWARKKVNERSSKEIDLMSIKGSGVGGLVISGVAGLCMRIWATSAAQGQMMAGRIPNCPSSPQNYLITKRDSKSDSNPE